MMRFFPIAFFAGCLLLTVAALPRLQGKSASGSAQLSVTHPISTAPPTSDGLTVAASLNGNFNQGEPPLPVSKARETANGSALYSRAVNRILCVAEATTGGKTWLGTSLGVKCVDRAAGFVRHYGEAEGLPTGRVAAIATDKDGEAWCVVEGRPTEPGRSGRDILYHLCAFQPANGTWATIRDIPVAMPSSYYDGSTLTQTTHSLVSAGPNSVVFTLGAVGGTAEAAYVWNRRALTLETILWEPGLRADNPTLTVSFVGFDRANAGLWFGTNVGLLHYTKSGTERWERALPDQEIRTGAVSPEGKGDIWVVASPRAVQQNAQLVWNSWKLYSISAASISEVQEVTPKVRESEPRTVYSGAFPGAVSNNSIPVAVTVENDGAVWLTQANSGRSSDYGQAMRDAWWHRDPVSATWTRYEMRTPDRPPYFGDRTPNLHEIQATGETHENISLSVVTDAAVRPLALYPLSSNGEGGYALAPGGYAVGGNSPQRDAQVSFWMRRRFPTWICADDVPAEARSLTVVRSDRKPVPDPVDSYESPRRVWVMDIPGTTLLHVPETVISEELRRERSGEYVATSPASAAMNGPDVERYPLPEGHMIHVRPPIEAMVPDREGKRLFLVAQGYRLLSLDTRDNLLTPVTLPRDGILLSRYNPPVAANEGGLILSSPNSSNSDVLRYDPKDGSFRVVAKPAVGGKIIGAAPNGGLWSTEGSQKLLYQAPGSSTPTPVEPNLDPKIAARSVSSLGATGAIGWLRYSGGTLVGYDVERKRWTPPLDLHYRQEFTTSAGFPLIADSNGGAYVASDDGVAAVYHYDRDHNLWENAAPPITSLPPSSPNESGIHLAPVVATADAQELWVLADARYLCRYDRRKKVWDTPVPLPDVLRGGHSSDNDLSVAGVGKTNAIYVGGRAGLWRFDRKERRWTELDMPLPVPSPETNKPGSSDYARVADMSVSSEAVFTLWRFNRDGSTFAARLDRRTGQWSFYDESRGFPERDFGSNLVGGGAWLIHGTGTYFFDGKRDVWRLAFGMPPARFSQVGERVPLVALTSDREADNVSVAGIITDPVTGDSFVLANPEPYVDGARPVLFRCDREGKVVARSASPEALVGQTSIGYSLLREGDAVLVATNVGVFRVPAILDNAPWTEIKPPPGLSPRFTPTSLRLASDGHGLYVMNNETVAYWSLSVN